MSGVVPAAEVDGDEAGEGGWGGDVEEGLRGEGLEEGEVARDGGLD
jgi:hypothetical protein